MAGNETIKELTELTTIKNSDILAVVDAPDGANITKKMTRANFLASANMSGVTVSGSTINTSNITINSINTLDVSAGTLTLADNQISGNKVEGGTISAISIGDLTLTSMAGNWTNASRTIADLGSVTTCDINGGTIDGVTIGGAVAPTVTNLGAVTTCDINGGSVDGTTIGAASPSTGAFTSLTATPSTNDGIVLDGDTILTNNKQLVAADFPASTVTALYNVDNAASGDLTDVSGNGYTLTLKAGTVASGNDVLGVPRKNQSDASVYWQSTNAAFNVANTADTDDFMVGGWVYIPNETPSTLVALFSNEGAAHNGWSVRLGTTGLLYAMEDLVTTLNTTSYAVPSAGWYHILYARDATTSQKLYVNGKLVGSGTDAGTMGTTQSKFQLGGFNGATSLPGVGTRYDECFFKKGALPTNLDDVVSQIYARSAKKFAVKDANTNIFIPEVAIPTVYVYAYGSTTAIEGGSTTMVFDHIEANPSTCFTTGVFTAPYSGFYAIGGALQTVSHAWAAGEGVTMQLVQAGSVAKTFSLCRTICSAAITASLGSAGAVSVYLKNGDTVTVVYSCGHAGNTVALDGSSNSNFVTIKYLGR